MPSLASIIDEVALCIVPFLDTASLAKLTRACRDHRRILTPTLYQRVSLGLYEYPLFLRTVIANPELPQHVRTIVLHPVASRNDMWEHTQSAKYIGSMRQHHDWSDKDLSTAYNSIERFKTSEDSRMDFAIQEGNVDAIVAMILSKLPKLRYVAPASRKCRSSNGISDWCPAASYVLCRAFASFEPRSPS